MASYLRFGPMKFWLGSRLEVNPMQAGSLLREGIGFSFARKVLRCWPLALDSAGGRRWYQ